MDAENDGLEVETDFPRAKVWLGYSWDDFERLVEYAVDHDEIGGRYSAWHRGDEHGYVEEDRLVIGVYTHSRSHPATRAESMMMCHFDFQLQECAVVYAASPPGFDLETAWLELGRLEDAAVGRIVHGHRPS